MTSSCFNSSKTFKGNFFPPVKSYQRVMFSPGMLLNLTKLFKIVSKFFLLSQGIVFLFQMMKISNRTAFETGSCVWPKSSWQMLLEIILKTILTVFSFHPSPFSYESEVKVLVAQLCPTLCSLMDHSLPGSAVHGISPIRTHFNFKSVICV